MVEDHHIRADGFFNADSNRLLNSGVHAAVPGGEHWVLSSAVYLLKKAAILDVNALPLFVGQTVRLVVHDGGGVDGLRFAMEDSEPGCVIHDPIVILAA